jgi:signal transduction histidine kinase
VLSHFETRREKCILVGLTALFALTLVVAFASAARQAGRRFSGFVVWQNGIVPAITIGPGLAAGTTIPYRSVVVAVNGAPIADGAALRARVAAAPEGTLLTYTFARGAQRTTATVPTSVLRRRDLATAFAPYVFNGLTLYVAAVVGFYFKPRLPAARAFLALGGILGGVLVLAIDTLSSWWAARAYFCLESFLPGALVHFAVCFPVKKQFVQRRRWIIWAIYAPSLVAAILQNALLTTDPERHLVVNDWVYTGIAVGGLIALLSLAHTYVRSHNALARQQVRVVTAGMVVAMLGPIVALLSIVALGVALPMNPMWLPYVAGPLSIGYAIARHNLFEVDRFLRTGVVYGALSLVVLLTYSGVLVTMEHLIGAERRLPASVLPLYLLFLILFLNPLRTRIQHAVDRLFYRQAYDYRGTVEATSRSLASFLDTDRIATTVLETLTEVMAVEWGVLFVFGPTAEDRRVYGRPATQAEHAQRLFPPEDPTLAAIVASRTLVTRYEVAPGPARHHPRGFAFDKLDALGAALLLPCHFEDEPVALLVLGEKRSGAYYAAEDIDLIQTLANQCALAVKNARAYEIIRATQSELVRAERLAAVGELAAAVAHGIRNPLAGIRAAAQVAREDATDPALVENLDDIIGEAGRLESRVRGVLDLARPFEAKLRWGDLNEFVRTFANNLRKRVPPGIVFTIDLDAQVPELWFDPVQLVEILEALVINAFEAIRGGGSVTIHSGLETRDGAAPHVVLRVADTGPGIEPEIRRRIFDLFYTTKASGTGVGLATAKRLVEQQGGSIDVASERGVGTVFTIRLPLRSEEFARSGDAPASGKCA